jgi:oxygen-dependent protoporphyrinogen oxidase
LLANIAPNVASTLASLKTVSSGTVSLGFRADEIDHLLDGFGFVIPRREPTRIVACTWSSTKLPGRAPEGHALIRVFVGGHGREQDVALPNDQLINLARADLRQIMGIKAEPVISRVFRWPAANPQYEVGHLGRLAQLLADCPPWLFLAGCAYNGVGIPDCVRQGREIAKRATAYLQPEISR